MLIENTLQRIKKCTEKNDIVKKMLKSFQFTDEPKFFQYTAYMAEMSKRTDAVQDKDNHGSGLDINKNLAQIKALGECIERYCLSCYRKKEVVKKSFNEINRKKVDPIKFVNFIRDKESQISKFHNLKFNWVECEDYFKDDKILIPAQLIYVPYQAKEAVIRYPISNGAAFANSRSEAIYKGVCELIERDAFMITYLKKIKPKRIELNSIKEKDIRDLLNMFKRYFLEIHILDITLDLNVPTILCILIDKSEVGPAISIGSKTDVNIFTAIKGALLEVEHTRTWIRYLSMTKKKKVSSTKNIKDIEDRGLFWCDKGRIKDLDFLINAKEKKSIPEKTNKKISVSKKWDIVKNIIKKKGYHLYLKDITTKGVKDCGFNVIKTVIPELHPLFLFEDLKYLYSNRLEEIGKNKGSSHNYLNKIPHPFV
ncbi:MAG: YcaO-like family protein [Nanoarchaeota archaeon]|nr:YcaO-like family protein [Nanoarchaeota archaeon]